MRKVCVVCRSEWRGIGVCVGGGVLADRGIAPPCVSFALGSLFLFIKSRATASSSSRLSDQDSIVVTLATATSNNTTYGYVAPIVRVCPRSALIAVIATIGLQAFFSTCVFATLPLISKQGQ